MPISFQKAGLFLTIVAVHFASYSKTEIDENLWLEAVEGKSALEWVMQQNSATDKSLASDPLYEELYVDAINALGRKDKLPSIHVIGDWVYNLWKNDKNPRGIYRRASIESFLTGNPKWQSVLDIDELSSKEGTNWVFNYMRCLAPDYQSCLVGLAPGGSDAHEVREFNPNTGKFKPNGFYVPVAKNRINWQDKDHLLIGSDFGVGSLTKSGYPKIIKRWQRGTPLSSAETIFEVAENSVGANTSYDAASGLTILVDSTSFWKRQYYQLLDGKKLAISLPTNAVVSGIYQGQLVVSLKSDWQFNDQIFTQGSVVLVAPEVWQTGKSSPVLIAAQTPEFIIQSVRTSTKGIDIVALENVIGSLYMFRQQNGQWQAQKAALPDNGRIEIVAMHAASGKAFVKYENFLTPPTLFQVDLDASVTQIMQQSATFDSSDMKTEQFFTTSQDGTKVPYFVIMRKDTKLNGANPTHIFSYGGFRNALRPSYSGSYEDLNGAYGNMWLARGGVYVLANIRGGGEFGPQWHAEALLENRPRSFEDFEAIAEDLVRRKITAPKHLGIEGRSNGGLLVGALMTRRPDLYGAVICGVPLLDMQRYHKLLAGASWMAEYGNPDTDDWQFMSTYSPYQNLDKKADYPGIFFYTSTKDDRVHPGHARKMAARMKAMGHSVEYYENLEGGHKGSATKEQTAKRIALAFTHLWRELR